MFTYKTLKNFLKDVLESVIIRSNWLNMRRFSGKDINESLASFLVSLKRKDSNNGGQQVCMGLHARNLEKGV